MGQVPSLKIETEDDEPAAHLTNEHLNAAEDRQALLTRVLPLGLRLYNGLLEAPSLFLVLTIAVTNTLHILSRVSLLVRN